MQPARRASILLVIRGALLALTVCLGACTTAPLPLSRAPSQPVRFKAFFSNRFGNVQSVELRGGRVISVIQGASFRDAIYGPIQKEHRVHPSEKEWRELRAALNRADLWNWQSAYKNAEFSGGAAWSLEVVYPKQRVVTAGYSAYPADRTPLESADVESRRYKIVERAVERLIGRPLFN